MKKYFACFLVGVVLSTSVVAYAAQKILIKVDGKVISTAVSPQIVSGNILVPINSVAPALGAKTVWDARTSTINIYTKNYAPPAKPTNTTGTVKITGTGITTGDYNSYGKFYSVSASASVFNSDKTRAAENVKVSININDSTGKILKTETGTISYIPPNSEAFFSTESFVNSPASTANAFINVGRWEPKGAKVPIFRYSNMEYTSDELTAAVSGEIENPHSRDFKSVRVDVALYNAGGKIIGGGYTFVDLLPANNKIGFKILNGPVKNMEVSSIKAFADVGPFGGLLE